MKISIAVGGRFHAFDLARQLKNEGHLNLLITSFPKYYVNKYGLNHHKIHQRLYSEDCNSFSLQIIKSYLRKDCQKAALIAPHLLFLYSKGRTNLFGLFLQILDHVVFGLALIQLNTKFATKFLELCFCQLFQVIN